MRIIKLWYSMKFVMQYRTTFSAKTKGVKLHLIKTTKNTHD